MANPTKAEVREAFDHLNSATIEERSDKVRVSVDESDIGELFREIRVRGFDATNERDGDTLVSFIDVSEGLGELFG